MHDFKEGDLKTSAGRKVKKREQAVAIGLRESGSSRYETPKENERNLKRTLAKKKRNTH